VKVTHLCFDDDLLIFYKGDATIKRFKEGFSTSPIKFNKIPLPENQTMKKY